MTNENVLARFFEAENRRDWDLYAQFLRPEVVWELHGDGVRVMRGIEDYLEVIKAAYADSVVQFTCVRTEVPANGKRIVTYLVNDLGERSVDIFAFEDGRIVREFEFLLG